jgi:hypothetical protein
MLRIPNPILEPIIHASFSDLFINQKERRLHEEPEIPHEFPPEMPPETPPEETPLPDEVPEEIPPEIPEQPPRREIDSLKISTDKNFLATYLHTIS